MSYMTTANVGSLRTGRDPYLVRAKWKFISLASTKDKIFVLGTLKQKGHHLTITLKYSCPFPVNDQRTTEVVAITLTRAQLLREQSSWMPNVMTNTQMWHDAIP